MKLPTFATKKLFNITVIGSICFLVLLTLIPESQAQDINCTDLRRLSLPELEACMLDSKSKEAEHKTRYQELANDAAILREQLAANEMEMRSLNSQAESERIRQRTLLRLQSGFQSPAQIEE